MPDNAPNVRGTALDKVLFNSPARLRDLPAAAQTRNAKIKNPATRKRTIVVRDPNPRGRTSCATPNAKERILRIVSTVLEGRNQSGVVDSIPPGVVTNVVTVSAPTWRAKSK
jgi:hypothetical protein